MSTSLPKILICDDEEGVRESLKLILGELYELILIDNSEKVLEVLKNAPDVKLVLLDIKMPKVSGLDILKKVKENAVGVHVIIITGYRSVETAAAAVKLGASGYIVKPFKSDEILNAVKRILQ